MNFKDPSVYIEGVLTQDRRVISKTITLIESSFPDHQETARAVLDTLIPHTGNAVRLGITGVPGVGKSTFIENLGMYLVQNGRRVAVLAVDPSSTKSGGSVMADKTRMERLSVEKSAFIRPSPSGGTLGGVARKTRESMLVCEAAGFDVIIVENVGVLELADAIAIYKADGDNIEKAKKGAKIYESALQLLQPSSPTWSPPVLTCSAQELRGIEEIWQTVLDHRRALSASGELEHIRRQQALDWMRSLVEEGLKERFYKHPQVKKRLPQIKRSVEKGTTAPTIAANELLFLLDKKRSV